MYTAYMGFYHHKNFETGDVTSGLTRAQLLEMARAGSIKREDYIRKDGHKTWHTADTVKGIDEILYLEHRTKILEARHLGEVESMHYSRIQRCLVAQCHLPGQIWTCQAWLVRNNL